MTISNVASLKDRLRAKMKDDREQTESLIQEHLNNLSENLKGSINNELSSIRKNLESETERLNREYLKLKMAMTRAWLKPLVTGLGIFIGIFAGCWGGMQYLSSSLTNTLEKQALIESQIQSAQETLNNMQTLGVEIKKYEDKFYIVMPEGYTVETGATLGNRDALKIIRKK